jgi:hypothetical protein
MKIMARIHGKSSVRDYFCAITEQCASFEEGVSDLELAEDYLWERDLERFRELSIEDRISWLRGQLWLCSSTLPGTVDDYLREMLDSEHHFGTYARAVRAL